MTIKPKIFCYIYLVFFFLLFILICCTLSYGIFKNRLLRMFSLLWVCAVFSSHSAMRKNKEIKTLNYLSNISTIHGLSYIGDKRATWFCRFLWILSVVLSCLWCFFYFLKVYDKVFVAPDIAVKISYVPLNHFPFPAITICPHNKVNNEIWVNTLFWNKFDFFEDIVNLKIYYEFNWKNAIGERISSVLECVHLKEYVDF